MATRFKLVSLISLSYMDTWSLVEFVVKNQLPFRIWIRQYMTDQVSRNSSVYKTDVHDFKGTK
jgi:hypothetical protein